MALIFEPQPIPSIAIFESANRIPVRRILCVGSNYAAHAQEMGRDADREPPFFFSKPADAVIDDQATIPYPPHTNNLHHEVELVAVLGKGGANILQDSALEHVWGYAVGNDLTRRDLQRKAKEQRQPWDLSKGFDNSAAIAPAHPVAKVGHLSKGSIKSTVNGELRQNSDLSDLIWSVPEIIATLSQSVELKAGDLIMTGTPAGVGPLLAGDVCVATIEGLGSLTTTISAQNNQ